MAELIVPATASSLQDLGSWLQATIGAVPGDDAVDIASIELAVHELAMNSIVHGYGHDPQMDPSEVSETVRFAARRLVDAWEFTITDAAPAFDPDSIAEPDEPQEHGYGLMIIRQLTREFLTWRADRRNHVRLVFDAPPLPTDPTPPSATFPVAVADTIGVAPAHPPFGRGPSSNNSAASPVGLAFTAAFHQPASAPYGSSIGAMPSYQTTTNASASTLDHRNTSQ